MTPLSMIHLVTLGVSSLITGHGTEPSDPLPQAENAWLAREQKAQSFSLRIHEERVMYRDGWKTALEKSGKPSKHPDSDFSISFDSEMQMKNNLVRYSYSRSDWSHVSGRVIKFEDTVILNRDKRLHFNKPLNDDGEPARVSVSPLAGQLLENELSLRPLLMSLRPSRLGVRNLRSYQSTGKSISIDGRKCLEFQRGSQAAKFVESIYLDPERDWCVCRIENYTGTWLSMRYNIEHVQNTKVGWIPVAWDYLSNVRENLPLESGSARITVCDINTVTSEDVFYPSYPKNSHVIDKSPTGIGTNEYVMKDDNQPGIAFPVGDNLSYDQLVQANKAAKRQRIWLIAIGSATLIILGTILVRWQQRRRARVNITLPPATA